MQKSLLSKYRADRALQAAGVEIGSYTSYDKTYSSVRYVHHAEGRTCETIVTCDVIVRDMFQDFGLALVDYTEEMELDEFVWETGEIDELVVGKEYILPVYVFTVAELMPIAPGVEGYGLLRAQCEYGNSLWRGSDITNPNLKTEFGCIESARAHAFWKVVRSLTSMRSLWYLAEYCLSYDDNLFHEFDTYTQGEYTPCIPNLSVPAFRFNKDGEVVPYDALMSLSVYAIQQGQVLYNQRSEY